MREHAFVHLNRVLKYAANDWARPLLNIILDAVFPFKCLVCGRLFKPAITGSAFDQATNAVTEITDPFPKSYQLLNAYCCVDCVNTFAAVSSPICTCCGVMFNSRHDKNHLCGNCITRPKNFRMARAAMVYDHQSMAVIHRFKYSGKIQLARPLGRLVRSIYMQYWGSEKVDLILPVPLHNKKFRKRGFNQSYLLIHGWKSMPKPKVAKLCDLPVKTNVLMRNKATLSQTGLDRQQRLRNIKDAFSVRRPEKVSGKKVLLVDDVYTTGATVNECARMLLKAGAEMVDVLTLARAM